MKKTLAIATALGLVSTIATLYVLIFCDYEDSSWQEELDD